MPTLSEQIDCRWREIKRCEMDGDHARADAIRKEINDMLSTINELGITGTAPSWEAS